MITDLRVKIKSTTAYRSCRHIMTRRSYYFFCLLILSLVCHSSQKQHWRQEKQGIYLSTFPPKELDLLHSWGVILEHQDITCFGALVRQLENQSIKIVYVGGKISTDVPWISTMPSTGKALRGLPFWCHCSLLLPPPQIWLLVQHSSDSRLAKACLFPGDSVCTHRLFCGLVVMG
jgi:hypothetical protein